jgi:hypothetical protein
MSGRAIVHVICHKEPGTKYRGLDDINPTSFIFESRAWRINREDAPKLIGGLFCLHSTKKQPSDYGGEILSIDYRPQADNNGEEMAVVKFQATNEARGREWPETNNPMEFLKVVIPHE